jgi:hypothetical protein
MADEGTVNSQITDSVTQVDTTILGNAPAQSTGMLDAVMAESIGMAMYNAVTTQHNSQMVASAAVAAACARMLKSPGALPPPPLPKLLSPVVAGANPAPVPVNASTQSVQVSGTNFQPSLSVDVFDGDGNQIGTLAGTQQVTDVTSTSFTMMANLFSSQGTYGIEAVNPDGGRSSRYLITAATYPAVTAVSPTVPAAANSYQVSGSNFQTNFTANVFDQTGAQLAAPTISPSVPPAPTTSFIMVIVPGTSTGPFSVEVLNPDGSQSNRFSFDAA